MSRAAVPCVMAVAGSDSGGGAGVQADLKTIGALGAYGVCAITALTAQNTLGVEAIQDVPPDFVAAQMDAVLKDIGVDAVKVGMVSSAAIAETVGRQLERHQLPNVVVDPVMVSASGSPLLAADAVDALKAELVPRAGVVTPNVPEAEALSGLRIRSVADMRAAAARIMEMRPRHVLVKGGHLEGAAESVDVLYDGEVFTEYREPFVETSSTHGTGCTFASALAVGLARGMEVAEAGRLAKGYVTAAIRAAYKVGRGPGPVNHFHRSG